MLSYDTKRSDRLLSKAPTDMPRELISSTVKHESSGRRGTVATKVPEDAGTAAQEESYSNRTSQESYWNRYKEAYKPSNDELIKVTSEAIMKGMPEVLNNPYRVNLTSVELGERNKGEEFPHATMAMTRLEYIQYVREQCEKELSYVPQRVMEPRVVRVEEAGNEENLIEDPKLDFTLTKELGTERAKEVPVAVLPLVSKESLEDAMLFEKEADHPKSRFLRTLWIRSIIAMCFFIGVVSFDLLNVRIGSVGIRDVKNIVANNQTIQKIEKIVSDFAENTVLPVFGIDKEDGQ